MSSKAPALTISFRLKDDSERDILLHKAKQKSTNVTDFLRGCIFGDTNIKPRTEDGLVKGLIDDITFMFKFFQKNAKKIDIDEQEKGRFGAILKKMKELTHNEP